MLELTEKEREGLKALQRGHRDKRVYVKVTSLLMLDKGYALAVVSDTLGIDEGTVRRYARAFEDLGRDIELYIAEGYMGYGGRLSAAQEAVLKSELTANLYLSSKEVSDYIFEAFGVAYTERGTVDLLHRLGFSYKKTKTVPCKADTGQQAAFLAQMQAILDKTPEDTLVFFGDAVHPQHNTRADWGWIPTGKDFKVPANSGRRRLNLNGAVNAHDPTEVIIQEDERINGQSTIALWEKQKALHPGKKVINFCDNASYYHSQPVKDWLAQNPHFKTIHLPPYSPNLNLIERLWKFLRKKVISYRFYPSFKEFRDAILLFFQNIKEHKTALESLLTLNFYIG